MLWMWFYAHVREEKTMGILPNHEQEHGSQRTSRARSRRAHACAHAYTRVHASARSHAPAPACTDSIKSTKSTNPQNELIYLILLNVLLVDQIHKPRIYIHTNPQNEESFCYERGFPTRCHVWFHMRVGKKGPMGGVTAPRIGTTGACATGRPSGGEGRAQRSGHALGI